MFHTGKTDLYPAHTRNVAMYERRLIKGIDPNPYTFLYIELQGKSIGHKEYFEVISFSKLFLDQDTLNEGYFKIPVYSLDKDPVSLL